MTDAQPTFAEAGGLARLRQHLASVAAASETELEHLLAANPEIPERLLAAMQYATLGAGKRLRPFLVHAAGELGGASPAACRRVGAAIELVHCYSLVHDDLPAMDNAELRRGKPSCHKAFGEAVAILAGDALVALAFDVLGRNDWPCPGEEVRRHLLIGLGRAAGAVGMCGGQMLDLDSTDAALTEADLVRLQSLKTGAIMGFALDAGCLLGDLPSGHREAIGQYASALGLAFQIKDDLLDAQGSAAEIGKDAGRDQSLGRSTFVSLLGATGAEERLTRLRGEGVSALDRAGVAPALLADLFDFVISRRT